MADPKPPPAGDPEELEPAPGEAQPKPRTAARAAPAPETPEDHVTAETRSRPHEGGPLQQAHAGESLRERLRRLWP